MKIMKTLKKRCLIKKLISENKNQKKSDKKYRQKSNYSV